MVLSALSLALALSKPGGNYVLRLHLQPGQVFNFALKVGRQSPLETGEIRERVEIGKIQGGVITMRVQIIGIAVDGKDRSSDLRKILGDQVVEMPWTEYSTRTGGMTPLNIHSGDPKVLAYLGEAGLYLCDYVQPGVQVGDSWQGSVTATGGCTSGVFTLKQVLTKAGKTYALFDVTDIGMYTSRQVGPMKMTVDLATGLPTYVGYTARDNATGRVSKFEQTLVPAK